MKTSKMKIAGWICATGLVAVVIGVVAWTKWFHNYPPKAAMKDVKAALAARNAPRPVDRFLEERYGPMTNSANREKAFLDFFNVDHIKGLNFLVSRMPADRRGSNITAMAEWISSYRQTMTEQEKQDLRAQLNSPEGLAQIHKATSQYLQQDVRYRAANAVVISELMNTLTTIQQ